MVGSRLMGNFMLKYSQVAIGFGAGQRRGGISHFFTVFGSRRKYSFIFRDNLIPKNIEGHTRPLLDIVSFVHMFLFFLVTMSASAETSGLGPDTSSTPMQANSVPVGSSQLSIAWAREVLLGVWVGELHPNVSFGPSGTKGSGGEVGHLPPLPPCADHRKF